MTNKIEFSGDDGRKLWKMDGVFHREEGPAVIWKDGSKAWFLYGKLHRDSGPALEVIDGRQEWWILGFHIPEDRVDADIILRSIIYCTDSLAQKRGKEILIKKFGYTLDKIESLIVAEKICW